MKDISNKQFGDAGEKEVVKLIKCPNCGKKLSLLPPDYPLSDVQCSGCSFRAQIKTNRKRPQKEIFGAGSDIIHHVLKAGFQIPPLIANFKWGDKTGRHQEILFYPFVPKANLKHRMVKFKSNRKDYRMFNYVGLDQLPHFVLYESNKNG